MPYPQTDEVFLDLVQRVLTEPEIRQDMDVSGAGEFALTQALEQRKQEAWASAAEHIRLHDEAEAFRESQSKIWDSRHPVKIGVHRVIDGVTAICGGILGFLILGFIAGWIWKGLTWTLSLLLNKSAFVPEGAYMLVFAVSGTLSSRLRVRFDRLVVTHLEAANAELEDLNKRVAAAREQVEAGLVELLRSESRAYLESLKMPVFSVDLPKGRADGLAEVLNSKFEITTESRTHVLAAMSQMHGAAIGIAGPRGVGKTTLLWSIWQSGDTDPGVLSVFTSAPVKYETRDFLLHLFSNVCSRVIEKQKGLRSQAPWRELAELRDEAAGVQMNRLRHVASLSTLLGIVLWVLGGLLAIITATAASPPQQLTKQPSAAQNKGAPASSSDDTSAVLKALDLKPSPFFLWGTILLVGGLYLGNYGRKGGDAKEDGFYPFSIIGEPWRDEARAHEEARRQASERDDKLDELGKEASRLQAAIRFQQSYSSGWTGALKLPAGLETGVNSAVQWAQQQMTLPELVSEYRRFLTLATQTYKQVIVAIDELDKLESDEVAQGFLNGIKAIFGQQGCYYLASVSQNAMSSFERRGLPFRDAFDSSFDDVLYLDYLSLDASRRLIARRVMNVPHPFVCFCHAMSGGLPRDLIRQCRSLFENQPSDPPSPAPPAVWLNLYALCDVLIATDRESKVKALTVKEHKGVLDTELSKFIAMINAPRNGPAAVTLWDLLIEIETFRQNVVNTNVDDALLTSKQALLALVRELQSYVYFLSTVAAIFSPTLTMPLWQQYVTNGTFDRLARVRQLMGVNQEVAVVAVEDLRRNLSLPVLPPPVIAVPAPLLQLPAAPAAAATAIPPLATGPVDAQPSAQN
jgi:hypothetical protein